MICIDRLIASACFESVNERERLLGGGDDEVVVTQNNLPSVTSNGKNKNSGGEGCSKNIVRECRICQEEDEEHEMEAPCACNGTLKVDFFLLFLHKFWSFPHISSNLL